MTDRHSVTYRRSVPARAHRRRWLCAVGGMLLFGTPCHATDVRVVAVTPGRSVDVVIDGGEPLTIAVGEGFEHVKVVRVDRDSAVLTIDGMTKTLPLVADPSVGHSAVGTSVMIAADARGQFVTSGSVNGSPMQFVVDTGATLTTLSRADASRIGLDYRRGTPAQAVTVNGIVPAWRLSIASVRVGDVTVRDVDAIVVENDTLSFGLLGMSFLDRFDMQRQGATLILRRRH